MRERVLNHSQSKLDKSYDIHEYEDEKRDALDKWANHLSVILANSKVVRLGAA